MGGHLGQSLELFFGLFSNLDGHLGFLDFGFIFGHFIRTELSFFLSQLLLNCSFLFPKHRFPHLVFKSPLGLTGNRPFNVQDVCLLGQKLQHHLQSFLEGNDFQDCLLFGDLDFKKSRHLVGQFDRRGLTRNQPHDGHNFGLLTEVDCLLKKFRKFIGDGFDLGRFVDFFGNLDNFPQ